MFVCCLPAVSLAPRLVDTRSRANSEDSCRSARRRLPPMIRHPHPTQSRYHRPPRLPLPLAHNKLVRVEEIQRKNIRKLQVINVQELKCSGDVNQQRHVEN